MSGNTGTTRKRQEDQTLKASQLWWASVDGDVSAVNRLLAEGADPNSFYLGETPLHAACMNNHINTIKALVNKGARVNAVTDDGWTPLHYSCSNGHKETTQFLLGTGVCQTGQCDCVCIYMQYNKSVCVCVCDSLCVYLLDVFVCIFM